MNTIKGLLGLNPQQNQLPKFEGDDVYPTALLDDTKSFRDMILYWTFHFNDVLDPDKLHTSLARLLEIGDWKKLGGRQRINDQDKLELHVPKTFTNERPSVKYSSRVIDMNIDDHPVAKRFPKASTKPSIHPGDQEFKEFATTSDDAFNGSDLLFGDKPQMSLNVVSFKDATLVSLVWPHTLMDAEGLQALLQNWSLVLAGRENEVVPLLGARQDVTCDIAETPVDQDEDLHIAHKRVSGFKLFVFGMRFLWDLFWHGKPQYRTIFMPKATIAKVRNQALQEMTATPNVVGNEKPFISEGDVISAWTARMVALSDPRQLPVSILNAANLRNRFELLTRSTGVYVQNLAIVVFAFVSPALIRGPLGPVALANRKHVVDQTTQPQLRALLQTLLSESRKGIEVVLFGEPKMLLVIITNWTKAYLTQAADFSSAVIRQGEATETRKNDLGQMTQVYLSAAKDSIMSKNVMIMKSKDNEGNYWLEGLFVPRTWVKIEEEIARLASDE
ncbi:hypothetical protein FSARC_12853 [Fusarium sarcochroum]|uniref:Uncharacterized protein n=1 Tax=Fusarium sarcochroum TaxID=1208366 RepID=A0A8H4T5Q3_9HYPO|nr:hypothetical protein FSARC_12853 [Fusarium sarcochroum]